MPDLRAVIFDYYGTLANFGPEPRSRLYDEVAIRAGAKLQPGDAFIDWRKRIRGDAEVRFGSERPPLDGVAPPFISFGEVWDRRFAELFKLWGVDPSPSLGSVAYADAHAKAPLYSDVQPALDALRSHYKLAVLSDADAAFLDHSIKLNRLSFDSVVSSEEISAYKPHIAMFRSVCERLAIDPGEAAYVGDSPWADMAGARNAGMRSIWINRHDIEWPGDQEPPDATITSLDEVPALLNDA